VTLGLGIWTFSFEQTNGILTNKVYEKISLGGPYPGNPFASDTGRVPDYKVEYSYYVNGDKYKGNRIGMGLSHLTLTPFKEMYWEKHVSASSPIQVYYSKKLPSVSVLYCGVDWLVAFCFMAFGVISLVSSKWLKQKYT
jgi:hypothetical protein